MYESIHAIVLKTVKHTDKTRIAHVVTRERGRLALAIPEGGAKKSTYMLWRPLALLEFQADFHKAAALVRPKDVSTYYNYVDLPYNPIKAMTAMFIDELLTNAIYAEMTDTNLFDFVHYSLVWLDQVRGDYANFHIAMAIQLLQFLGIQPNVEKAPSQDIFDMRSAEYTYNIPMHRDWIDGAEAAALQHFARMNYRNMRCFRLTRMQRRRILELINIYYIIHVPGFNSMQSIDIFNQALQ